MRVVHIGFPKTATTFLQRVVFPALPGEYAYIGERAAARYFTALIEHDESIFDVGQVSRAFQDTWSGRDDMLFSYEPLTGIPYGCGFVNRTPIATRLKAVGFERVIITIRNQFDALESSYKQYVKSGGVVKFGEYVSFDRGESSLLHPRYFAYDAIYRLYASIFGPENVLLLQYEDLGDASFTAALARFLEVDTIKFDRAAPVNQSLSHCKTRLLRVINYWTCNSYRPAHPVSRRISTSYFHRQLARMPVLNGEGSFLTPGSRSAIEDFYAGSNRRLQLDGGVTLADCYPGVSPASPR